MAFIGQATMVNWCPLCQVEGRHHTYDCPNFNLAVAPSPSRKQYQLSAHNPPTHPTELTQFLTTPTTQETSFSRPSPPKRPVSHDPHHPRDPNWSTASCTMVPAPMGPRVCTSTNVRLQRIVLFCIQTFLGYLLFQYSAFILGGWV